MDTAWRVISWSLKACYDGKWPTHNWLNQSYLEIDPYGAEAAMAGKDLADGMFLVPWSQTGDLKHFHENLLGVLRQ